MTFGRAAPGHSKLQWPEHVSLGNMRPPGSKDWFTSSIVDAQKQEAMEFVPRAVHGSLFRALLCSLGFRP